MKRINNQKQAGFTLIEILVVVIIIGILAAIAIPTYLEYVKRGYASDAIVTIQAVLNAAEVYQQETGDWPQDVETLENEGYLDIKLATKKKWQFNLSVTDISATSLADMKGGEGNEITFYIDDGIYKGYGQKEQQ